LPIESTRAENRDALGHPGVANGPAALPWGRTKSGNSAGFIGTLAGRAQARYRGNDQESHKSLKHRGFSAAAATKTGRPQHMRIALFEPDIPQNTGTILRLAACLGVEVHLIEPAGFPVSDRAFRRAGMDYLDQVSIERHPSWASFESWRRREQFRLVLFTTRASTPYIDHAVEARDILLFGRESAGVPDEVHEAAEVRLKIPMREGLRSLNVAMVAAMAVGEAMRQSGELKTL
jgi:tRNA (cytidine/uridine-2'-O-)-methyltransferase